ncbi:MAG: DNA cytosine methyltransferase [Clostridiales bacterium]|jgi:DNA (cytosine-5)-methyltransferase 1|nr:DNA cytosine methyltransferase [Clostridiales bacterium]
MKPYKFKFIDLFAGIGGFHQAMRYLGGECVMASEINQACVDTYKLNFKNVDVRNDIRKIDPESIPQFDVLCAGFPCQPFSKAGAQKGFSDEHRGNLFYVIMDILDAHPEAKFLILENVRNLADKTENWDIIKIELMKRNFYITEEPVILSPHNFGIPQIRERVYILGMRKDIRNIEILTNGYIHSSDLELEGIKGKDNCKMGDAMSILEPSAPEHYAISDEQVKMIFAWEEFRIATNIKIIGFPIWINSFGVGYQRFSWYKRKIGYDEMPKWKQRFVDNNRRLYESNKDFIDDWIIRYDMLNRIKLYQKFEWNCGTDVTDIRDTIIQIRQSGIRAKRPTFYPSLVAMVNTPIIWDKEKERFRRITPHEAANLQSFHGAYKFTGSENQIYQQLGNSVNVKILKKLSSKLFSFAQKGWDTDEEQ